MGGTEYKRPARFATGEPRGIFTLALLAIMAAGAALRVFHLTTQDLWLDEIGTVNAATAVLGPLTGGDPAQSVLPTAWLSSFYYAILRSILLIPGTDPDSVVRIVSAVLGIATIPALAWTGSRFFPARVAVGAATLIAVSPFHTWYSQEGRPYALLLLLSTLALGFYLKAYEKGATRWWAAFSVCSALALYTHPIAIFLPMACFIGLLAAPGMRGTESRSSGVSALVVTGLLYLPAAIWIGSTGLNQPADPRSVTLFDIPYAIYTYCVGFSLGPSTSDLHESAQSLLDHLVVVGLAGAIFATLVATGVAQILKRVEQRVLLLAWLVVPIATAFAAAALTANPFNPRYAITAYPAFVLVLASGLWWFSERFGTRVAAALAASVIGLSLLSLSNLYFDSHYSKEATRELGQILSTQAGPSDLILVNARYMEMAVNHYYSGQAEVVGYPRGGKPISDVSASDLRELTSGRPQVWLVLSRTFHGDREGHLRSLLSEHMEEVGEEHLTGIAAYRFLPRS